MYSIRKDYRQETKDLLKVLNDNFYNFSKITIDLKNFKFILNDNAKTEIIIKNFVTVEELIHANFGDVKSLNYKGI